MIYNSIGLVLKNPNGSIWYLMRPHSFPIFSGDFRFFSPGNGRKERESTGKIQRSTGGNTAFMFPWFPMFPSARVADEPPETAGSDKFPAISGSEIPKSVSDSSFDWFPADSGIRTLFTYLFVVSQVASIYSSSVSLRLLNPSSVPFRSSMDIEAGIRPLPSSSCCFDYSAHTWQSSKSTRVKLPLSYQTTSNGASNTDFGKRPLFH